MTAAALATATLLVSELSERADRQEMLVLHLQSCAHRAFVARGNRVLEQLWEDLELAREALDALTAERVPIAAVR